MTKIKHLVYTFRSFAVLALFAVFLSNMFANAFAEVITTTDPETQQQSWLLITDEGLELKIAQITPDQAHGFFLARGFPSQVAHDIATHCPMQTVIKNTGTAKKGVAITVLLKEWQVKHESALKGVKLKEVWQKEWQDKQEISAAAKLAFRWATFPSEQTFRPRGDYNWGVTTIGLSSATARSFDLNVVWYQNGVQKNQWIYAMTCAKNN
jgi:hypothetical protein